MITQYYMHHAFLTGNKKTPDNCKLELITLTHETPKLPSYRNQSIDLLCKSICWFLYDGNFGV